MNRSTRLITTSLILSIVTTVAALGQVQFKQPIIITLSELPGQADTLWLGVSGDGPGGSIEDNTYLPDVTPVFGAFGAYREAQYPGDPPPPFDFFAKWIDIPGRSGMGMIRPWDFRGYYNASQVDSFQIRVNGDGMSGPISAGYVSASQITLTWQANLSDNCGWCFLLKCSGASYLVVSDMLAVTSYTDSNVNQDDMIRYIIIKGNYVDDFYARFSASPDPVAFGPRPTGSVSNLLLTVSNTGGPPGSPLDISSISISNSVFSITPAPPITITQGASLAFTVTYTAPMSFGTQTGAITFTSNAPTSPDIISVTGTSAMNVPSGWNLVSVPLVQSNDSAVVVFPDLYGDMMEYVPGTGYVPAPILTLGTGYWLNYVNPNIVAINGSEPGSVIFNASSGWNIIGSQASAVDVGNITISGGNSISGGVGYAFVPGSGYAPVTSIQSGQGVWVYLVGSTTDCTITIPVP